MRDLYFDEPQQPKTEKTTKEHKYTDEKGKHLYSVCRLDGPEGKRIWQKPAEGYQLRDVKHTVYNLPQIKASAGTKENLVLIAEGEKCCDAVADAFGLVCTTNSGGALKWTDKQSEQLKGCEAVLLPDRDETGIKHGSQVAESLHRHGIPCKIINLPGLAEKEDVADWIEAGGTYEQLTGLIDDAPYWEPEEQESKIFSPTWDNEPEENEPLIELRNTRILSPGNISMITAGAGAGKSSVLEAICASVDNFGCDTLGLSSNAKTLLDIDTERSFADHHKSWQRYMRRRGLGRGEAPPENIQWVNIRGLESLEDRLSYLYSILENPPELILIDGIGDFVADPNDSEEVTTLINKLCSAAHMKKIGILVTLHNNPAMNNTKARGVLGSELWRKCECTLIIEKLPDGVRKITTDYDLGKNRSGSDQIGSCFKWCDEKKMHVSCDRPAQETTKGKTARDRDLIISRMGKRSWSYGELKRLIIAELAKSEPTAKRIIKDLTVGEIITKGLDNTYSITGVGK